MKKILIALDYAPNANIIAETGYTLAKKLQADVYLLHVVTDASYYSTTEYSPIMGFTGYIDIGVFNSGIHDGLQKGSTQFLEKTKLHLADDAIHTIVAEGNIADTIIETATSIGAAIIVLGSHSRNWIEQIVLGSVAEKVLKSTTIPLLVIPIKK